MREIPIDRSTDGTTNKTRRIRTYFVHRECYEPFIEELTLMHRLNEIVRSGSGRTWIRRAFHFRKIMQLQQAINERRFGFDKAKQKAVRSALMFSLPVVIGNTLSRFWKWQENRRSKS